MSDEAAETIDSLTQRLDENFAAAMRDQDIMLSELKRLHETIDRLTRERDSLAIDLREQQASNELLTEWRERAEKAEARCREVEAELAEANEAANRWQTNYEVVQTELERKTEALRLLLACPEIADCAPEDKDPDTHRAERLARAALSPADEDDDPCHGPQDTTCPSCGLGGSWLNG
jgi:chromosome segregation ATPase